MDSWTGARVAEGSGLLSRPASNRRVGSNPTPSACGTEARDNRRGSCRPSGLSAMAKGEARA